MKKKILLTLPCVVAVSIAAFVGAATLKLNSNEGNSLLLENIEALSQENDEDTSCDKTLCYMNKDYSSPARNFICKDGKNRRPCPKTKDRVAPYSPQVGYCCSNEDEEE